MAMVFYSATNGLELSGERETLFEPTAELAYG
jgi:hypothetical protein